MDFHSIINAAKQNVSEAEYERNKFYKTKFDAPKKTIKEKKLTNGIQKFLQKQKLEEEEKARKAREKKLELLARRDPKEQRKIEKTLKVIKSSKKFYTGDKELDENTEITLEKSIADDDDYDFESKTSDTYYQKLMEKYNKMPQEDKFANFMNGKKKPKTTQNKEENGDEEFHFKNGHRERVSKIKSEGANESPKSNHNKKSQSYTTTSHNTPSSSHEKSDKKSSPPEKPKPKIRAAPPVNFEELLKLAAQKQNEDIVIDVPSKKEPERLMTLKEKKELEEIEAARKAKFKGGSNGGIGRIPKLGAIPKIGDSSKQDKNNNSDKDRMSQKTPLSTDRKAEKSDIKNPSRLDLKPNTSTSSSSGSKLRDALTTKTEKPTSNSSSSSSKINNQQSRPQVPQTSKSNLNGNSCKPKESSSKLNSSSNSKMPPPSKSITNSSANGKIDKSRLAAKEGVKPSLKNIPQKTREFPPKDLMRTREFPPKDLMKTREFPPRDLKKSREFPPRDLKRPTQQQMSRKRRVIEDEDDDSEYDSELDDFIDDGEEDFDYSNEIQKMFGYDKSRFRDEESDDDNMESDYRTVMREEFISKKIGIMEDLEDMRMEAEENRRKEMMRKKKRKV